MIKSMRAGRGVRRSINGLARANAFRCPPVSTGNCQPMSSWIIQQPADYLPSNEAKRLVLLRSQFSPFRTLRLLLLWRGEHWGHNRDGKLDLIVSNIIDSTAQDDHFAFSSAQCTLVRILLYSTLDDRGFLDINRVRLMKKRDELLVDISDQSVQVVSRNRNCFAMGGGLTNGRDPPITVIPDMDFDFGH
jgi:hypothetical protein